MPVFCRRLHPSAQLPEFATEGAAGADLRAVDHMVIQPNSWALVGTGLAVEVPEGYEMQIRPRSGLALKKGVTVLNSPGTIDSDYRGELKVILVNHGRETFYVEPGDRIAQAVVGPVDRPAYVFTSTLADSDRGEKGFGSTGRS